jgi:hypothetical protein
MLIKLQGRPNVTYQAQTTSYSADSSGIISTATLGDGDLTALLRQGVTVISDDGRPTVGSYTPPGFGQAR